MEDHSFNPNDMAMPRNMTVALAALLLQLLTPLATRAFDPRDYQTIRTVFDRLTTAAGSVDALQPKLKIIHMDEAAHYEYPGVIIIDDRLFDLCRSMKADSLNALAVVISHELAHCYLDHGGFDAHDRASQRMQLKKYLQWVVNRETEADFYGGIYRHLAGYDSYITAALLEKLYDQYGYFDDSDGEHLKRDKRKDIAATVNDSLAKLIPVFDMANNLTLIRLYGVAQVCYDYLIARFPSREMLNNAGIVDALQAMELIDGESARFTYPFELEEDTRLSDVKIERGIRRDRGTRSPTFIDSLRIVQLLNDAEGRFSSAAAKDSTYEPAVINLAAVKILGSHFDEAVTLARQLAERTTDPRTRLVSLTIQAIAEARMGKRAIALDRLRGVVKTGGSLDATSLALANLAVLDSETFEGHSGNNVGSIEKIDGAFARDTALLTHRSTTREDIGGDSVLSVASRSLEYSICLGARTRATWIQFICTGTVYSAPTVKNIQIGSPLDSVEQQYGYSPRIVSARRGRYYIYDYSKIIFLVDDDDKVVRWMIYQMGA